MPNCASDGCHVDAVSKDPVARLFPSVPGHDGIAAAADAESIALPLATVTGDGALLSAGRAAQAHAVAIGHARLKCRCLTAAFFYAFPAILSGAFACGERHAFSGA